MKNGVRGVGRNLTVAVLSGVLGCLPVDLEQNNLDECDGRAKTWMEIEPVQCGGNPWEGGELEGDNGTYFLKGREGRIRNFYRGEGIELCDARLVDFKDDGKGEVTCAACSCPRGDTLYVLVPNEQVDEMFEKGFDYSEKSF